VQLKLEQAFSFLKDAETAQRGYMLTDDPVFLQLYYGAQKKVDTLLAELKQESKDNQQQQLNMVQLKYLMDYRFKRLDYTLNSYLNKSNDLHERLLMGKVTMDRIRQHLNVMRNVEISLLNEREKKKDKYVSLTYFSVFFVVLLSFGIIAFSYNRISYRLKLSKRYADELEEKNQELAQKNQQLEKSNEELHSFNYIASHDLREPLRKIKTFNSLIIENDGLTKEARKYAERVNSISSHMQNLLDDLLAYSRMCMGEKKREEVNLNSLLENVKNNMREMIAESGAIIDASELPTIPGIRFQLEQLFENLISNSIKYKQPDQPPHIVIKSSVIPRNNTPLNFTSNHQFYTKISFSDNGIGFDQKYAEKVFELFQRLHVKKDYSGTGIGLTICRKIVDKHEGLIIVHSEENKGTTFEIYLPSY
jgi:signal transduction histidine kinase